MRSLGLQNSLTCDGVLQSARSIEAAFAPPVPPAAGVRTGEAGEPDEIAAAATARRDAVSRSRKLLDFVDHRADQLLLASGDSGRWFVDNRSGATGAAAAVATGDGDEQILREYDSSSESESEADYDEDGEDGSGDDEGGEGREAKMAAAAERRERKRERKERDNMRAAAAAAASRAPPPNEFVEELASIAWLPVHGRAPNDLLPWKVCWFSCPPRGGGGGSGGGAGAGGWLCGYPSLILLRIFLLVSRFCGRKRLVS